MYINNKLHLIFFHDDDITTKMMISLKIIGRQIQWSAHGGRHEDWLPTRVCRCCWTSEKPTCCPSRLFWWSIQYTGNYNKQILIKIDSLCSIFINKLVHKILSLFVLSRTTKVEKIVEDGGERDIEVHVDRNLGNKYSCVKKN